MAGPYFIAPEPMRIGIDFGTSYSAAGAVVDGQLQLIR
jgi:hypothetical chaperone protein